MPTRISRPTTPLLALFGVLMALLVVLSFSSAAFAAGGSTATTTASASATTSPSASASASPSASATTSPSASATSAAPNTGTGVASTSNSSDLLLFAIIGLGLLAVSGGAATVAIRSRR